jgi:O-antigen/teichoic acid export membrane protein
LVGTALLAFRLNRYVPIRPTFHRGDAIAMLRASAPYLVTALTLMVYQQMDKLLIGALASTEAVGWYGTAMNLVGTLMFIPVALGTVLFPTLSRSYAAGQQQLADVARRSFDLMFLLGVPIGLGVFIIARPLVLLLYGTEFTPAGDILALLGIVLIFMYVNTMLGQLLISAERTNPWNAVMVFATIITLPLDLYLIPMAQRSFGNGALGGAMSFLFTELLMTFAAIALLPRGTLSWRNLRTVAFVLCAGLTMAYVSTRALELNLVLAILGGAVTYPAMVLLLRVLPKEDLLVLKGAAARLIAKLRKTPQPAAASAEDEATQEPTVEQPTAPTTIPQPRAASDAKL